MKWVFILGIGASVLAGMITLTLGLSAGPAFLLGFLLGALGGAVGMHWDLNAMGRRP
jgi:hypothetical protein